jgi:hypothetical protein
MVGFVELRLKSSARLTCASEGGCTAGVYAYAVGLRRLDGDLMPKGVSSPCLRECSLTGSCVISQYSEGLWDVSTCLLHLFEEGFKCKVVITESVHFAGTI